MVSRFPTAAIIPSLVSIIPNFLGNIYDHWNLIFSDAIFHLTIKKLDDLDIQSHFGAIRAILLHANVYWTFKDAFERVTILKKSLIEKNEHPKASLLLLSLNIHSFFPFGKTIGFIKEQDQKYKNQIENSSILEAWNVSMQIYQLIAKGNYTSSHFSDQNSPLMDDFIAYANVLDAAIYDKSEKYTLLDKLDENSFTGTWMYYDIQLLKIVLLLEQRGKVLVNIKKINENLQQLLRYPSADEHKFKCWFAEAEMERHAENIPETIKMFAQAIVVALNVGNYVFAAW
jgi:hypothetical protein